MEQVLQKIAENKKIIKIDDNCFEIITDAEIEKDVSVKIFVKKIDNKIYLSDNQNTLRFMSTKYELKAPDVKQCINDIVKYYKFIIDKGELLTELRPFDNYNKRYNDLLVCSCTLANMFIFFENPTQN
jgi:hypothetical protein